MGARGQRTRTRPVLAGVRPGRHRPPVRLRGHMHGVDAPWPTPRCSDIVVTTRCASGSLRVTSRCPRRCGTGGTGRFGATCPTAHWPTHAGHGVAPASCATWCRPTPRSSRPTWSDYVSSSVNSSPCGEPVSAVMSVMSRARASGLAGPGLRLRRGARCRRGPGQPGCHGHGCRTRRARWGVDTSRPVARGIAGMPRRTSRSPRRGSSRAAASRAEHTAAVRAPRCQW